MPTFQSIGLHPEVADNLVSVNGNDEQSFQPIRTPQALLSRHANHIHLLDKNGRPCKLPNARVQTLRYKVAAALIASEMTMFQDETSNDKSSNDKEAPIPSSLSPGLVSAHTLWKQTCAQQQQQQDSMRFCTNCPSFDRLVSFSSITTTSTTATTTDEGLGLPPSTSLELTGPPHSGKTQTALQYCKVNRVPTVYITTQTTEGIRLRLCQLCDCAVLNHIQFVTVRDHYELLQCLEDSVPPSTQLVIVDSLSVALMQATSEKWHAAVALCLKRLVRTRLSLALIVVSNKSSFRFGFDVTLSMEALGPQLFGASVRDHAVQPAHQTAVCRFCIGNGGMQQV